MLLKRLLRATGCLSAIFTVCWKVTIGVFAIVVLMDLAPFTARAVENPTPTHLEQHRELIREFQRILKSDPKAALDFAKSEVEKAKLLDKNDPKRGDTLELLALAYFELEEFDKVIDPITEVVRIRKLATPVDHALLALALGVRGTTLFALDRSEQADDAIREALASWREAFGPKDIRLAEKLELNAEYVQKGFGRKRWAIELLQEAVTIREANPDSSPGKLAETLQELAIHQIHEFAYSEADNNLSRAGELLESEIAKDPVREENKAGLVQILVLRAGIAGALAQRPQALAFANAAKRFTFKDRALRAEKEILVPATLSSILEKMGDFSGAIAEQKKVLSVYRKYADLTANGVLDEDGIADILSKLGTLYLNKPEPDLDLARRAVTAARQRLGDTSSLLFLMSELERKSGNEEESLNLRNVLVCGS